jgi:putative membrane protein
MQFLKTVFWVLVAVIAVLFASWNWRPVTVNLWANLEADIKLPVLLLAAFLLGWLPTWLFHRARLWTLRRRLDVYERQQAQPVHEPEQPAELAEPAA